MVQWKPSSPSPASATSSPAGSNHGSAIRSARLAASIDPCSGWWANAAALTRSTSSASSGAVAADRHAVDARARRPATPRARITHSSRVAAKPSPGSDGPRGRVVDVRPGGDVAGRLGQRRAGQRACRRPRRARPAGPRGRARGRAAARTRRRHGPTARRRRARAWASAIRPASSSGSAPSRPRPRGVRRSRPRARPRRRRGRRGRRSAPLLRRGVGGGGCLGRGSPWTAARSGSRRCGPCRSASRARGRAWRAAGGRGRRRCGCRRSSRSPRPPAAAGRG